MKDWRPRIIFQRGADLLEHFYYMFNEDLYFRKLEKVEVKAPNKLLVHLDPIVYTRPQRFPSEKVPDSSHRQAALSLNGCIIASAFFRNLTAHFFEGASIFLAVQRGITDRAS